MRKARYEMMYIEGNAKNSSQSGILNGTCKGECWLSDDKMLGVTYSYPVCVVALAVCGVSLGLLRKQKSVF